MSSIDPAVEVIAALESLGVPYMLVGSYASNAYGIPRSTQDADFVVILKDDALTRIVEKLGNRFSLDPQISFESVTGTTFYTLLVPSEAFRVELFVLNDDEHYQDCFRRKVRITLLGQSAWLLSAEDLIVTKLRWCSRINRPKDLDDVQGVMAVQAAALDWTYIRNWCGRHGTTTLLDECRETLRDRGIDV